MISLNNLKSSSGSRKKSKRLWRWDSSWKGSFSWKWCKWQNARSWWWVPAWFEWGQTPLFRRMPKLRWFSNKTFKKEYNIINLSDLALLASKWIDNINKQVLLDNNIIRKKQLAVKLLWNWELNAKLYVIVDKASIWAKFSIEKAWGKLELNK